jgi:excisionase family DNA binding protein
MEGKLLTVEEAAEKLRVSPSWIYKKVAARFLPCFRIGRTVRFSEKEIDSWLQSHHVGGCQKI